ncbi:hypothetical protein MBLNU457_3990t1 [Dothideomycetes sp. NU457]
MATDTPWMASMSESSASGAGGNAQDSSNGGKPPTVAAFSPNNHNAATTQRSTILLHHKTPLLLATPPQVTRALAYSHPFILPLNKLAGLLSWTTGDPWESFLMLASFWFVVLYGDHIVRYGGPLVLVVFLILGMYYRRYSPLSSSGWTGEKHKQHKREPSDVSVKHRKSLDEILATLQTFTTRCNILMDPMMRLTEFLSVQQTATSTTTRPALTALFIRILLASPVWLLLTLPPFHIITTKRILLVFGTFLLSWHSRPARISRSILWRSNTVRTLFTLVTGLTFAVPQKHDPAMHTSAQGPGLAALATKRTNAQDSIRFSFSLYENQRRWIGLGWTHNMIGYERSPWTDEHLNASTDTLHFQLPRVEGGMAEWRWVEGSEWHIEVPDVPQSNANKKGKKAADVDDENAWVYYDNKWQDPRRGQDSWSRYTRRRKWVRDAELVDVEPKAPTPPPRPVPEAQKTHSRNASGSQVTAATGQIPTVNTTTTTNKVSPDNASVTGSDGGGTADDASAAGHKRKSWFGKGASGVASAPQTPMRPSSSKSETAKGTTSPSSKSASSSRKRGHTYSTSGVSVSKSHTSSQESQQSSRSRDDDVMTPTARLREKEADWGLGDDVSMHLE